MKELEKSQLKYLESDEFKKAQKIARMSIKKHLELYDKAEKFDQMKIILEAFFLEKANQSNLTDYMECYETLGKLKDITVDTSDSRIKEEN